MFGSQWHHVGKHGVVSSRGEVKGESSNGRSSVCSLDLWYVFKISKKVWGNFLFSESNYSKGRDKCSVSMWRYPKHEWYSKCLVAGGPVSFPCTAPRGCLWTLLAVVLGLVLFRRLKKWLFIVGSDFWFMPLVTVGHAVSWCFILFQWLKKMKGILKEILEQLNLKELWRERPIGRLKTLLKCQTSIKLVLTLFSYF